MSRASDRSARSGHEADEPGQLQRRVRVPARSHPRCCHVNYIHNNLVRTIEDVGQLVDGRRGLRLRQPGRRHRDRRVRSRPRRRRSTFRRPKRQYDALQLSAEPPVLGQLVPRRQLRPEPAVRQLRGHRQLGRNPDARLQQLVCGVDQQQAAQSLPPGRQRQSRAGTSTR